MKQQRGFLLFEVTLLLSILGLLAVFVVPKMSFITDELSHNFVVDDIKEQVVSTALLYKAAHSEYPTGLELGQKLRSKGLTIDKATSENNQKGQGQTQPGAPKPNELTLRFRHKCKTSDEQATITYIKEESGYPVFEHCGQPFNL
jgi:type II secretory pathway pseudopilin PulG